MCFSSLASAGHVSVPENDGQRCEVQVLAAILSDSGQPAPGRGEAGGLLRNEAGQVLAALKHTTEPRHPDLVCAGVFRDDHLRNSYLFMMQKYSQNFGSWTFWSILVVSRFAVPSRDLRSL